MEYNTGMLVKSKSGHDRGTTYIIKDLDDTYVYLVNGKSRTLSNPKKKKRKHVQVIGKTFDVTAMDDTAIKRIIKMNDKEA